MIRLSMFLVAVVIGLNANLRGEDPASRFPEPPSDFDITQSVPHGALEMISYDSKSVGTERKMQVYVPPNYSFTKKYPVLYLLHGIGGDETEWTRFASPNLILDNLIAIDKAMPMIVVMPNGRAQKDDRPTGDIFKHAPAFEKFEDDLLGDVIPAIEARYSVETSRESRALAGLSMGGGQTLNFGLKHLDTFAWVGAFSPAPNTKKPTDLVPDKESLEGKLNLLWVSCGEKDSLMRIALGMHEHLEKLGIAHVWHTDGFGHDTPEWKYNFYLFAQRLFTK